MTAHHPLGEYIKQEGVSNLKGVVCIDLSPKSLSVNQDDDWVEGPLDEMAGAYNTYMNSPDGQRRLFTYLATGVMVQRELSAEELFRITKQSLKTPHYVAAALFASGLFADNMAEAKVVDESIPALNIVAEHWADTAISFTKRHFPSTKTAVLGGHRY